ncbi:MAG: hypothetical protein V2B18_16405, partial [Pseudomonadota bacterium]
MAIRIAAAGILIAGLLVFHGTACAITCDACMKIEKEKKEIALQLFQVNKDLEAAVNEKRVKDSKDLDSRNIELMRRHNELKKHDSACRDA